MPSKRTNVHSGYHSHRASGLHAGRSGRRKGAVTLFTKLDHPDRPVMAKGRSRKAR